MSYQRIFSTIVLGLLFSVSLFAAGEIDTSFNPVLKRGMPTPQNENVAIQPDGKILVWGYYQENNTSYYYLRRLNTDGSEDTSFQSNLALTQISNVITQNNGKILIGGSINLSASKIIRLNSDGSLDTIFNTSTTPNYCSCTSYVYAYQADGKVYGSIHSSGPSYSVEILKRYNFDGSEDTSFAPLTFNRRGKDSIGKLIILPDGKLMIGGKHSFGVIFRVNQDGTKDITFESPILTSSNFLTTPVAYSFILKPDGKVVFGGSFDTVNGLPYNGLARLNSDGSVDTTYIVANPAFYTSAVLSNGKYIVSYGNGTLARFNSDDTIDNTFTFTQSSVFSFAIDNQDRVVTPNFRLNYDGSLDTSFNRSQFLINGNISLLAKQNDGKILAVGNFTTANSISKTGFARFNADGTTDTTFNVGSGFNYNPQAIDIQPDGKILVGGFFNSYNGNTVSGMIRLNTDGSLDTSFNSTANGIYSFVLLSSGKILIGGTFSAFNGIARPALARLNSDGTFDSTFNASLSGGSLEVRKILAQSDGKYFISGYFNSVGGQLRTNFARINNDGTIDMSFNFDSTTQNAARVIIQQPNGKYLCSYYDYLQGQVFKRLNVDGSIDSTFQSTISSINSIYLQSDGYIVIGGSFTIRANIARLKPNGELDSHYMMNGANANVNTIISQPDGKLIVGGDFSSIENNARTGIARINVIPSVINIAPFDFDGDGKSDFTVFRPSNRYWYGLNSSNSAFYQVNFGASGDILAPADYNFDGKCDLGIFRNGEWWYQAPNGQHTLAAVWGQAGDKPIPSDWDGDGKTDWIVFRPSNGVWYRISSVSGQMSFIQFGIAEDIPLQADFDGDGKSDVAVYRPSTGTWYWLNSSNGQFAGVPFGAVGDKPQTGDYDGDGKTDLAVYRPSNGYWYFLYSGSGYSFGAIPFGTSEDRPTVADYDGDGKTDIAVFRPSTGTWYVLRSQAGFAGVGFGTNGDIPIPSAYYP
jgi:uncharacterized delta-60 repeat protein